MNNPHKIIQYDFTPTNFEQLERFCKFISESSMVPKDYINKPGNVLVAVQMGSEIGLKPLQALQNISVINGRPSVWGDALLALIKNNPICESIKEVFNKDKTEATCTVKRKGDPEPVSRSFTIQDAKKAGLIGKDNWSKYPSRMLQLRARAWALRDVFPDVLCGMQVIEEQQDREYEKLKSLNINDINATLQPLQLSTFQKEGKLIVSGNTYQKSDILKKLGFTYENKQWYIDIPIDLTNDSQVTLEAIQQEPVSEIIAKTTPTTKDRQKEESKPQSDAIQSNTEEQPIHTLDQLKEYVKNLGFKFDLDLEKFQKWMVLHQNDDIKKHEKALRAVGFSNYEHRGVAVNITDLLAQEAKCKPVTEETKPSSTNNSHHDHNDELAFG